MLYFRNAERENKKVDRFFVETGLVILDEAKPGLEVEKDNNAVCLLYVRTNRSEKNKLGLKINDHLKNHQNNFI